MEDPDVSCINERIMRLKARAKHVCSTLQNLEMDRAELSREAELLSQDIGFELHDQAVHHESPEIVNAGRVFELGQDISGEIVRCRGGVDLPENYENCVACMCTLCTIENSISAWAPCDCTSNKIEKSIVSTIPLTVNKLCEVQSLRESLENLKNHNHSLKRLAKKCGCKSMDLQGEKDDFNETGESNTENEDADAGNRCDLIAAIKILQNKCRTKDGMIAVLADELRRNATAEETARILAQLTKPQLHGSNYDFDRTTLWNYLTSRNSSFLSRKTLCHFDVNRGRDYLLGFIFLLLIILPFIWRLYLCVGLNVINTIASIISCIPAVLLHLCRIICTGEIFTVFISFIHTY